VDKEKSCARSENNQVLGDRTYESTAVHYDQRDLRLLLRALCKQRLPVVMTRESCKSNSPVTFFDHKTGEKIVKNSMKPTSIRCLPLVPPISADLKKKYISRLSPFLQILTKYFSLIT
jgi:hypothetical protein